MQKLQELDPDTSEASSSSSSSSSSSATLPQPPVKPRNTPTAAGSGSGSVLFNSSRRAGQQQLQQADISAMLNQDPVTLQDIKSALQTTKSSSNGDLLK